MGSDRSYGLGPFGLPSVAESLGGWWLLGIISAGILLSNSWQPLLEFGVPLLAYLMGDWIAWLDRKFHRDRLGSLRTQRYVNLFVGIVAGMWLLCIGASVVLWFLMGKWAL